MKRLIASLVVLLVVGALGPPPASAQQYRYWWQVTNERGMPLPQGTVTCNVYNRAADGAAAHVFTSINDVNSGTTSALLGNSQGVFEFFWTDNTTTFDVVCWSRSGNRARLFALDRFTHTVVLDRSGSRRISRFPFHTNSSVVNTEVVIPTGGVVRDVLIHNLNPIVAGLPHISIGFAGNHAVATYNALAHQMALTSGDRWIRPHVQMSTAVIPVGRRILCYSSSHRGGALQQFYEGCGDQHFGLYAEVPYQVHVLGGLTVTYITSAVAGLGGHVYVIWDEAHIGAGRWGLEE